VAEAAALAKTCRRQPAVSSCPAWTAFGAETHSLGRILKCLSRGLPAGRLVNGSKEESRVAFLKLLSRSPAFYAKPMARMC
jgi:hypothetical protein